MSKRISLSLIIATASLRTAAAAGADDDAATLHAVEVHAALDTSRNQLSPDIGASQYVFDSRSIEQLPLGDATPLNRILLQAPGVVQDSFGELHIRGDEKGVQYRVNGVIIPESISGFGQAFDPDMIARLQLLTGALPAQYGYRTAGVVEITTESGARRPEDDDDDEGDSAFGGRLSVLGGSFGVLGPEISLHGSADAWSYFLTAEFDQSDVGIENPTPARHAIHDHTDESKNFGYVSYLFDEQTRLSFLFGSADNRFQIPDNPHQAPAFSLAGVDAFDSATLDERQRELTDFGALSLQGKLGATDYQVSLGQRYSSVNYRPDPIGDLIFHGVASTIDRSNRATTLQADVSTPFTATHTVRYGLYVSDEQPLSRSVSQVFPADAHGDQSGDVPFSIVDDAPRASVRTYGVYAQDQWDITDTLAVNYGLRGDAVDAYTRESQVSPRLGFVYRVDDATTLHAGYARYFTPPPTELISPSGIALFQGTTNQLPSGGDARILSERSHYLDVGVSHRFGAAFTVGLDAYYREVRDLLDDGQFGAALIDSPFNYRRGRIGGVELSANYTSGHFSSYWNLASSRAMGRGIVTGQYNFEPDELAYVAAHWVHLDHEQRLTGSGGAAYDWNGTRLGADFLYGSGLRAGFANTAHLPDYYQVNLSANRDFTLPRFGKVNLRLALINVTDRVYEIRDGSGIGVGAPQFGPRRGAYLAFNKPF